MPSSKTNVESQTWPNHDRKQGWRNSWRPDGDLNNSGKFPLDVTDNLTEKNNHIFYLSFLLKTNPFKTHVTT